MIKLKIVECAIYDYSFINNGYNNPFIVQCLYYPYEVMTPEHYSGNGNYICLVELGYFSHILYENINIRKLIRQNIIRNN